MKHLFIIAFSLLYISASGQNEQLKKPRKLSYGLYFSPTFNYRKLTSDAPNDLVKNIRDKEEIAGLGYRAGITFDYRISKKISLQSGMILSNRFYKTSTQNLLWSDATINGATESFISQQYIYMDIPLKLKYNISSGKRLNWFVAGGVNTSLFFLYNRNNNLKISNEWEVYKDQSFFAHPLNFFGEIETGMEYQLSPKFKFRTAINFQHALIPTNSNLKTKEFLYSSGVSLGLVFTPQKRIKK